MKGHTFEILQSALIVDTRSVNLERLSGATGTMSDCPLMPGVRESQSWLLRLVKPTGFRSDSSGLWQEVVKGVVGEGE